MPRNLLAFRVLAMGIEDWGGSGDVDAAEELLAGIAAGSFTDLDLSRFPCFWKNLGNLDAVEREGEGEGVCREGLVDMNWIRAQWPCLTQTNRYIIIKIITQYKDIIIE